MNYLLKILENVKNKATTPELAEKQVLDLLGVSSRLNEQQLKRVSKMLENCASDAWDAALDTYDKKSYSFDDWWKERNKVNLNG